MSTNDSITGGGETHYRLYVFPFSLYSIMARFTAALGAAYHAPPGLTTPRIELKLVDLHADGELEEEYLLHINPKGQVPAMTSPALPAPLTDSRDISYWLARQHYPGLLPEPHRAEIEVLLAELHAIQAQSLSVKTVREEHKVEFPSPKLDELLARDDISEDYREALRFKKKFFQSTLGPCLQLDNIAKAKKQAGDFLGAISALRAKMGKDSLWIFGDAVGPTILDAHTAAFVARLVDAEKEDLVPRELQEVTRELVGLPEWAEVTHGRSTSWNISYGHVGLLENI